MVKVIISETGWPGKRRTVQSAVPSSDNMMKYYIKTQLCKKMLM
jgi:exo-beta-1,3-glucanase (GH17 family)